jgi:DNA-binding transcriptional MocR family regulator
MARSSRDPRAAVDVRSSPELRREAVRRRVAEAGFVRVDALAAEFAVSTMTVHRDLDELEKREFLRKVPRGCDDGTDGDLPRRPGAPDAGPGRREAVLGRGRAG